MNNFQRNLYKIHNSKGIKKYVILVSICVGLSILSMCSGGCSGHSSCNSSSCSTTSNIIEI